MNTVAKYGLALGGCLMAAGITGLVMKKQISIDPQGLDIGSSVLVGYMKDLVHGEKSLMAFSELMQLAKIDKYVTATRLSQDYNDNPTAATQEHQGKRLLLTGIIGGIGKNAEGLSYASMLGNSSTDGIRAMLNPIGTENISDLKKGREANLVCGASRKDGAITIVRNCLPFDRYADELKPEVRESMEQALQGDQTIINTKNLRELVAHLYVIGSLLDSDSPCLTNPQASQCIRDMLEQQHSNAYGRQLKKTLTHMQTPG